MSFNISAIVVRVEAAAVHVPTLPQLGGWTAEWTADKAECTNLYGSVPVPIDRTLMKLSILYGL